MLTNEVLRHSTESNFIGNAQNIYPWYEFENFSVNSLRLSDAYMHQYNMWTLPQIMACHLFAAKPLSEPVLPYCQLDHKEHISVKFLFKIQTFSFKEIHIKMLSAKVVAILPGINVLRLHPHLPGINELNITELGQYLQFTNSSVVAI